MCPLHVYLPAGMTNVTRFGTGAEGVSSAFTGVFTCGYMTNLTRFGTWVPHCSVNIPYKTRTALKTSHEFCWKVPVL